jgi:hypothetical protein
MKNLRILELGLSGIVIRRWGPLIIGSRTDVAILALLKILGIAQATLLVLWYGLLIPAGVGALRSDISIAIAEISAFRVVLLNQIFYDLIALVGLVVLELVKGRDQFDGAWTV